MTLTSFQSDLMPDRSTGGAVAAAVPLARGVWHEFKTEVQLNTPGQANGSVRLYLNGILVAEKTGIQILDKAQHHINNVMFGGWYSNSAAGQNPAPSPATPTSLLIDDVRIETTQSSSGELTKSTFDRTPDFEKSRRSRGQ